MAGDGGLSQRRRNLTAGHDRSDCQIKSQLLQLSRLAALPHFSKYGLMLDLPRSHLEKTTRRHSAFRPFRRSNNGWFDDVSDGPVSAQVICKLTSVDKRPPRFINRSSAGWSRHSGSVVTVLELRRRWRIDQRGVFTSRDPVRGASPPIRDPLMSAGQVSPIAATARLRTRLANATATPAAAGSPNVSKTAA
jgi:hypothetical protein